MPIVLETGKTSQREKPRYVPLRQKGMYNPAS